MVSSQGINIDRKKVRELYKDLFQQVANIFYCHDPIGISMCLDEYEPEVCTILPRIKEATCSRELRKIIHQEFVRWFDDRMAGSEERYEEMSVEVWEAWNKFMQKTKLD